MNDLFAAFDDADEEAERLAPAVRAVLDPSTSPAARADAIAEIRAASVSVDAALRTFSDSEADGLSVARAILEAVLSEPAAPDLESAAIAAVEMAAQLGEHAIAEDLAARSLAARPDSIPLAVLLCNARANQGAFDPEPLSALAGRDMPPGLRRRVYANLGVAHLATGRASEGLAAWQRAAMDAATLMTPDVAVTAHGEPVWIQRMRQLLQLDGLGQLATTWGIGGPRMVVLLEGLAGAATDPETARLLRAEANARLRAGRERFAFDPDQPDVTLDDLLADAADFARRHGLDEIAHRLQTPR
jgi:phage tail protein X